MKVGVMGAAGRMGTEVCRALDADPELELVARVTRDDPLETLTQNDAQVAVDFTLPDAVKTNVRWCIEHGIHVVVGTSGLDDDALAEIETWLKDGKANVFVAPNFAVGAVLMMAFAAKAAPHFDTAEIVERHHEKKLDAPSGTSLRTASMMNDRRDSPWKEPDKGKESLSGSRGGIVDGVRIHSLRVPGSVAHQDVILGTTGETLTIRHDSLERSSFMPGVIMAVKNVEHLHGLTVGLEKLLGI